MSRAKNSRDEMTKTFRVIDTGIRPCPAGAFQRATVIGIKQHAIFNAGHGHPLAT